MADVNRGDRPLSPHLTVYRWQLSMVTSILTRITGNALLITALLIVWWFVAAATSADHFATVDGLLTSWFGDLVMVLSLLGLWYHTLAGIRHLIWDSGRGLDLQSSAIMGWGAIIGSVVLTLLTILVV